MQVYTGFFLEPLFVSRHCSVLVPQSEHSDQEPNSKIYFTKFSANFRRQAIKHTDKRVRMMQVSSILSCLGLSVSLRLHPFRLPCYTTHCTVRMLFANGWTFITVLIWQELLSSVKLIKMYAWEAPFSEQIKLVRKLEAAVLHRAAFLQVYFCPSKPFDVPANVE